MPDLDAIRQRANAATPGPWHVAPRKVGFDLARGDALDASGRRLHRLSGASIGLRRDDAEFAAHAREDVPALLDEVERLEVERNEAAEIAAAARDLQDHAMVENGKLSADLDKARGVLAVWELVASREEVTAVQRLAAVRALCHNLTKRANPANCYLPVSDILHALDGESTKDGA